MVKTPHTGLTDPFGNPIASPSQRTGKSESPSEELPQDLQLPEPTFVYHVLSLVTAARSYMGISSHPSQPTPKKHQGLAKYHIDTISMLKDKFQNALTADENHLLEEVLYELRTLFVKTFASQNTEAES